MDVHTGEAHDERDSPGLMIFGSDNQVVFADSVASERLSRCKRREPGSEFVTRTILALRSFRIVIVGTRTELSRALDPVNVTIGHSVALMTRFSEREVQIMSLAVAGHGNRDIGARLGISPTTVKWHLKRVFSKTGVTNRNELTSLVLSRPGSVGHACECSRSTVNEP